MQIYINKNGQQLGPFDENTVRQMLKNGQLSPNDLGIKQGQQQWQKLGVLFPTATTAPAWGVPNVPVTPPIQPSPTNIKSSSGKKFGLIGCGSLILLFALFVGFNLTRWKFFPPANTGSNTNSSTIASSNKVPATPAKTPVSYTAIQNKAEEFAKLSPPVKLDPNAKIKGKVAFVEKYQSLEPKMSVDDSPPIKMGIERLAATPEEIDTLVQEICGRGKVVGQYQVSGTGKIIKAYAHTCTVSFIDYKKNIVFARKSFVNAKPEESVSVSKYTDDIDLSAPEGVFEYVYNFPMENFNYEKTITDAAMLPEISKSEFGDSGNRLGKLVFPLKLDPNAAIKGKIATVELSEYDQNLGTNEKGGTMVGLDRNGNFHPPLPNAIMLTKERLGFVNEQLATNTSEIDTLIQVVCKEGNILKKINGITVYSNMCKISIVDYKGVAVIAEKTIEGKSINADRYTGDAKSTYEDKTDTVESPRTEIEEYIKNFPKQ